LAVDEAIAISRFDELLPELLTGHDQLHSSWGHCPQWDARLMAAVEKVRARVRAGAMAPSRFGEIRHLLDEMRLVKDASEVRLMKTAARISAQAHGQLMKSVAPGRFEYEMEAELLYAFRRQGADGPAYTSIVAGGANACVLHYVKNSDRLKAGDLLLVDAGCEYQGYASDITRTFPVNGRFSGPQRDLYEVVWAAQQAALREVRPGRRFDHYHQAALGVLVQGLIDLKLCRGTVSGVIESGAYRQFYMHRTGHWLGRDVHDVGSYSQRGKSRLLEPGMVVTVEPGLYVGKGRGIPPHFANIGIRIEDDAVVTARGHEVLTSGVPSRAEEIEQWMKKE
jgi:Xaa-Pro aminopeptidase